MDAPFTNVSSWVMAPHDSQPWNPDRAWADPLIALLLLVVLFLAGTHLRLVHAQAALPETRASLQGRVQDALLGGAKGLEQLPWKGWTPPRLPLSHLVADTRSGWDQAILAVHAGEAQDLASGADLGRAAPGPAGDGFRQAWRFAYRGEGSAPDPAGLAAVQAAMGDGYAARILEARVRARSGGDGAPLEASARAWALSRLAGLALAGLAGLLLALAGLAFGLFLILCPAPPRPLPQYRLSGRALAIVMLGWFLTFLTAGSAVASLTRVLPWIKPFQLTLVYALHAGLGIAYLCRAEGLSLGALWRRLLPGPQARAIGYGLGYFALAFSSVLAVALVLGPLLSRGAAPQRQLFEVMTGLKGFGTVLVMFLTVAGLAPAFEELLFRGVLLPWLSERMERRQARHGRLLAVALTAAGFAAMHLQPLGLPTLTTLGLVLGFAFLRTANLGSAILVHGLWNGGVFLLVRSL